MLLDQGDEEICRSGVTARFLDGIRILSEAADHCFVIFDKSLDRFLAVNDGGADLFQSRTGKELAHGGWRDASQHPNALGGLVYGQSEGFILSFEEGVEGVES